MDHQSMVILIDSSLGDNAGGNIAHNIAMRAGTQPLHNNIKIFGAFLSQPCFWSSKPIGKEPIEVHENKLISQAWEFVFPSAVNGIDNYLINPSTTNGQSLHFLSCSKLLVYVAKKDPMRERGVWYHQLVTESGWNGELELFEMEDEVLAFHINIQTENAKIMIKRLASFLRGVK